MKETAYILFFVLFTGLFYGEQPKKPADQVPHGTYVVTADVVDKQGILTNLITADSIFVYGNWAIETKVKTQLLEINGVPQPRKMFLTGYIL